jgi:CheY-like chemotaxis protein
MIVGSVLDQPPMARPLILVVEDDQGLRDLYRVALGLSGLEVHAAEDGLEALHYLEDHRPDLIVLDLDLPKVPGVTLYSELRVHPRTENIPILVVTGVENPPLLPGVRILRKPLEPDILVEEVQKLIQRRSFSG